MKQRLRRWLTPPLLLLLALLAFAGWTVWQGNYHVVREGEVYRAGQLSAEQLQGYIEQDGIRSIINLQGPEEDEQWYRDELKLARQHNITHTNFKLSARKELSDKQLRELVRLMKEQPKPLLIHCLGGADRTSLASALYLYAVEGVPPEKAADQLSVRFGHFPYLFRSEVEAMDKSFERYITRINPPEQDIR